LFICFVAGIEKQAKAGLAWLQKPIVFHSVFAVNWTDFWRVKTATVAVL
jgi:hypothetical protein